MSAPPILTLWPDPEQWQCRGCGLQLDTPRHVSSYQIQNQIGFWTACAGLERFSGLGLLGRVRPLFDAAEARHGKR